MVKLIRCPAGHVYDSDAHSACPECARIEAEDEKEEAQEAKKKAKSAAPSQSETAAALDSDARSEASGIPVTWIAGGGIGLVVLAALGFFLLRPNETPTPIIHKKAVVTTTPSQNGTTAGTSASAGTNNSGKASSTNTPSGSAPTETAEEAKTDPDYQACSNGNDKAALDACTKAIESGKFAKPELAVLYVRRSTIFMELHNLDAALKDINEVITLDPDGAPFYADKCNVLRAKGQLAEALAACDQAIKLDPKYSIAYLGRGIVFKSKGDLDLALKDDNQAVALMPNDALAHTLRGQTYQAKGDGDKAKADFQKALTLNPTPALKRMIEAGLKAQPPATAASTTAAQEPAQKASSEPAQGASSKPASSNASVEQDAKTCTTASGETAIAACTSAIQSKHYSGVSLGHLYDARGVAYANGDANGNNKNLDAAMEDFTEAIKLEPEDFIPLAQRGARYDQKGEEDRAIQDLTDAIKLKPDEAGLYNNRGLYYRRAGKLDAAMSDLNRAIALDPKLGFAYENRGDVYRAKGDSKDAIADYKTVLSLNPDPGLRQKIEAHLNALTPSNAAQTPAAKPQQPQTSPPETTAGSSSSTPAAPSKPSPPPPVKPQSSVRSEGSTADAKTDKDYQLCAGAKDYQALIADCGRAIHSGKWKGDELAALYYQRATGYEERGRVMDVQGGFDDAIDAANQAIKLAPRTETYALRGDLYSDEKKYAEAAEDYQKALSFNPTDNERKDIQAKLDKLKKTANSTEDKDNLATDTSSKPATSQPANTPAAEPSGAEANPESDKDYHTCSQGKDEDAAEDACTRAIKSGKWSGSDLATLYYNRANYRADYEDFDDALSDAAEAIKLAPEPDTYQLRGEIYDAMDEEDKAIDDYRKALSLDPNPGELKEIQSELDADLKDVATKPSNQSGSNPQQGTPSQGETKPAEKSAAETGNPQTDADYLACEDFSKPGVAACNTAIASNKFTGKDLAKLYVARGMRAVMHQGGSASDAPTDFSQAMTLDPTNVDAAYDGGIVALQNGDYSTAIADLKKATALDPDNINALWKLGEAYKKSGDAANAAQSLKAALALNPEQDDRQQISAELAALGTAAAGSGPAGTTPQNANDTASSGPLSSHPGPAAQTPYQVSANSKTNASNCFGHSGDAAIVACSAAILSKQISGTHLAELYAQRCFLRGQARDFDGALADCNQAVSLAPNEAGPYGNRGSTYMLLGKFDLALADLNKAIQIEPTEAGSYNTRGLIDSLEGKWDQALQDFNMAIQYDSNFAPSYLGRARVEQKDGNRDAAKGDLNTALSLSHGEADQKKFQDALGMVEAGKPLPLRLDAPGKPTDPALLNPALPAAEAWDDKYCGKGKVLFKDDFKTLKPSWGYVKNSPNREIDPDGLSYDFAPGQGGIVILNTTPHGTDYEACALIQSLVPENSLPLVGVDVWATGFNNVYTTNVSPSAGTFFVVHYDPPHKPEVGIKPTPDPAVVQSLQATNAVSVTVRGDQGTVAINGQVAGSFIGHPPANGGYFGFHVFNDVKDPGNSTFIIKGYELREAAPLVAQTGSNSVQFCNDFTEPISFALAYPTDQGWKSQGWARVDPKACQAVGQLPDFKTFYYRAETDSKHHHEWAWGKARSFSVRPKSESNFAFTNANLLQSGAKYLTFDGPIPNPAPSTVTIDIDQNKRVAVVTAKH
jgi:tetratricopeptide (TPR) repeat protein